MLAEIQTIYGNYNPLPPSAIILSYSSAALPETSYRATCRGSLIATSCPALWFDSHHATIDTFSKA
jgi:hypothetical protein